MWIKLLSGKNIERQGKMRHYNPGDWVRVGKQLALRWIAQGGAERPGTSVALLANSSGDAGIVVTSTRGAAAVADLADKIGIHYGAPELKWDTTLIWDPAVLLRQELIAIAFNVLSSTGWEMLCPLLPYDKLALALGSPEDKERTKRMIGDLRVPLYDPRLIYLKRCPGTEELMERWDEERVDSQDQFHSFLRAVYWAKPLVLALPPNWVNPNYLSGKEDW